jgi:histidinol-phosphatase
MTIEASELDQLLKFTVNIAREAGEITLKYYRQPFTPERKTDGSFVTIADREAERYLRSEIEKTYPDDAILGEEEGERPGSSKRRWIIDPIDGTYSFVHGVPFYGVLIGLEINSIPMIGAVNMPALNEIVYAARGRGCFWNGIETKVSSTEALEDSLLLCTDFGICSKYGFEQAAKVLQNSVASRRTWGDCYGHVLVATGRAEIMLDPVMNIWDCAALAPIIEEAGGTFTDWNGERTICGGNAISTNSSLFEKVIAIIRQA